jgi:hypothetical protein
MGGAPLERRPLRPDQAPLEAPPGSPQPSATPPALLSVVQALSQHPPKAALSAAHATNISDTHKAYANSGFSFSQLLQLKRGKRAKEMAQQAQLHFHLLPVPGEVSVWLNQLASLKLSSRQLSFLLLALCLSLGRSLLPFCRCCLCEYGIPCRVYSRCLVLQCFAGTGCTEMIQESMQVRLQGVASPKKSPIKAPQDLKHIYGD